MNRWALLASAVAVVLLAASCAPDESRSGPDPVVVVEGLIAPIGLAETPDGRILVAEDGTGEGDNSAGVSLIDGVSARRVVSGFPSGRDSGDLAG